MTKSDSNDPLGDESMINAAIATAVHAARKAGELQLSQFRRGNLRASESLHDVKLEMDKQCETVIVAAIKTAFPDHSILTEESGLIPGRGECQWIIDPLDGTVNFWHGLPFFCVSIACFLKSDESKENACPMNRGKGFGNPLAGVVYLPYTHELFVGAKGMVSTLNGHPIKAAASDRTLASVVGVSFGKTEAVMRQMSKTLSTLLPNVRKVRCLGAAAAELVYVAAGYLGGLVYDGIQPWDFAAAKIIIEGAGGTLEAVEKDTGTWRVLAYAPHLGLPLKQLLADGLARSFQSGPDPLERSRKGKLSPHSVIGHSKP